MTTVDIALPRIQTEEGFRGAVYRDTEGHQTIGYGFNLDAGISRAAAAALLIAQLQELDAGLKAYPWYSGLDAVRQSVCLDIAFNQGKEGLLGYVKMLAAIEQKDWETAQAELLDSKGARQLPSRYETLGLILLTGVA
jgi:lysozyme